MKHFRKFEKNRYPVSSGIHPSYTTGPGYLQLISIFLTLPDFNKINTKTGRAVATACAKYCDPNNDRQIIYRCIEK